MGQCIGAKKLRTILCIKMFAKSRKLCLNLSKFSYIWQYQF